MTVLVKAIRRISFAPSFSLLTHSWRGPSTSPSGFHMSPRSPVRYLVPVNEDRLAPIAVPSCRSGVARTRLVSTLFPSRPRAGGPRQLRLCFLRASLPTHQHKESKRTGHVCRTVPMLCSTRCISSARLPVRVPPHSLPLGGPSRRGAKARRRSSSQVTWAGRRESSAPLHAVQARRDSDEVRRLLPGAAAGELAAGCSSHLATWDDGLKPGTLNIVTNAAGFAHRAAAKPRLHLQWLSSYRWPGDAREERRDLYCAHDS